MEKTMRKIILSGMAGFVLVCGACGAEARSSDEEDAPQAAAQAAHAPPFNPMPVGANLRAAHKPAPPAQEDDSQRY
jgi:hypothetical protein